MYYNFRSHEIQDYNDARENTIDTVAVISLILKLEVMTKLQFLMIILKDYLLNHLTIIAN